MQSKIKNIPIFKLVIAIRGLLFGVAVALILLIFSQTETFSRIKLIALDLNYKFRPPIHFRNDLGYIDFDDRSIITFGKWPWTRNRETALNQAMSLYGAKVVGYDVFFTEPNDIVFNPQRIHEILSDTSNHKEPSAETAFRDYDLELEESILNAGNIYLPEFMILAPPEIRSDKVAVQKEVDRIFAMQSEEKKAALEIAEQFSIPAGKEMQEKLFSCIDVVPPLARFVQASAGIGFAQITEDMDKTVRLSPLFIQYNGKAYPALSIVILSKMFSVPLNKIQIVPGHYVEFPNAKIPINSRSDPKKIITKTIRIPVNENCQMLVNWAGEFLEHGIHVSYSDIAEIYALNTAKKLSMLYPAEPDKVPAIFNKIHSVLSGEILCSADSIRKISIEITVARIAEGMMQDGSNKETILKSLFEEFQKLGLTNKNELSEIIDAVEYANSIADGNSSANSSSLKKEWTEEIKKNIDFFAKRSMADSMRPLFFPLPFSVINSGKEKSFSPVDLEGRIYMVGLTGEGTIDLNPTPYQSACPMVALHLNTLNTILTEQFLRFPGKYNEIIWTLFFAIIVGIISALLSPSKSFIGASLISGGYIVFVLWAWNKNGQWVPAAAPLMGIAGTWSGEVLIALIKAIIEKQRVRNLFSTMVSPRVLKLMEEHPDRFSLTGERKEATIMFSAIEGFGDVMKREAPEELTHILGNYLTPTSEIIMDYDGYIDKYEGHVIMADFGVPLDDTDHAWKCCFSAIEQQLDIEAFRLFVLARYGAEVKVTMGINSGYISAGNMGSEKKMQYTVMGDAVNVSARFRPANGIYGTSIITGESTQPLVSDKIELRLLDRILLKGKTKPTTIYEVMGWKPEAYLSEKRGKPLSDSALRRWLLSPPQKVFGYIELWRRIEREKNIPIAKEIADFFESQISTVENIIVNFAVLSIDGLKIELEKLEERCRVLGDKNYKAEDALASSSEPVWRQKLLAYLKRVENLKERIDTIKNSEKKTDIDSTTLSNLVLSIETMKGKIELLIENLPKRPKSGIESIARKLAAMREKLEGKEFHGAEETAKKNQTSYRNSVASFFNKLSLRKDEYHEAIAEAGAPSQNEIEMRTRFEKAMQSYFERKWDESKSFLEEALKFKSNDSPSAELIKRIDEYKVNPPGAEWQGEFIQRKK
ncbi:MAG: hypothetical protein AUJ18_01085 [Candidatus Hydrogenedentes bacterium CG1_02_42_14]|nr:MAG: hypothetical protein AUJ18_01085 [Candidatus Hydrogenedentes bacterium CG1_02_42_14]